MTQELKELVSLLGKEQLHQLFSFLHDKKSFTSSVDNLDGLYGMHHFSHRLHTPWLANLSCNKKRANAVDLFLLQNGWRFHYIRHYYGIVKIFERDNAFDAQPLLTELNNL